MSEKIMPFPIRTLQIMIVKAHFHNDQHLYHKLREILGLSDLFKQNRWFGYYQHLGEQRGYWTLDEIIELVSQEKQIKHLKSKVTPHDHPTP
jgi:hypothetical protein